MDILGFLMFGSRRIIAIDVNASKVVVAEFVSSNGVPEMLNYGVSQAAIEPESATDISAFVTASIRDIMKERDIKPAPVYMCISGQTVFPRYVKLPPVTRDKVLHMIQYEAEQNVPFPIDEVVWDYQLIEDFGDGELNAMIVAAKTESVVQFTDCVMAVDLEPDVVDVAPMAIYNSVRYNYPDLDGCTMILDIGVRASSLIFIEGSRIFSRSIPVAGNTVTQELMKEFDVSFEEAEALKQQYGFVAFGGVYAGPEDETADWVSKIVRNVMTRLHAEINRSINFYRSQQGGNPPVMALLTGAASTIPHTDTFFREKLGVEVEYFNPFVNVTVSSALDMEALEGDLHMLAEVSGLALRHCLSCPVEINLLPPDIVASKTFRKRQPFFAMTALGVVLTILCWWVYFNHMGDVVRSRVERVEKKIGNLNETSKTLASTAEQKNMSRERVDKLMRVIKCRTRWLEILDSIQSCMLEGMWLTSVKPVEIQGGKTKVVEIEGKGFDDKLRLVATPDQTAAEIFVKRLKECECFSEETKIKSEMLFRAGDYARQFKIWIVLKDELKI